MKPGDIIPAALWYNALEEGEMEIAKDGIADVIGLIAEQEGVVVGTIDWTVLPHDSDRLPEPPKFMARGVKCLLGEAEVLCRKPAMIGRSFVMDLDAKDLERLRQVTRRVAAQYGKMLTDIECDDMIEAMGPDAALSELRNAVNTGTVH